MAVLLSKSLYGLSILKYKHLSIQQKSTEKKKNKKYKTLSIQQKSIEKKNLNTSFLTIFSVNRYQLIYIISPKLISNFFFKFDILYYIC